ncbi:MAG: hypothetical protein RLY87_932 [Chloroflexota bacterium]|jgi:hypothetical protein
MPPYLLVLIILTTFHAALAHAFVGKTVLQLPVFWLATLVGVGIIYATRISVHELLPTIGTVHIVEVSIGGWLALYPTIRATTRL